MVARHAITTLTMTKASSTVSFDDTALLLLSEQISKEVKGAEVAAKWSAPTARSLVELVAAQKGVMEPGDVPLLREVKLKFKASGITSIGAREKAVALMFSFLTPKAVPKSEDKALLAKEFLKAAQAGAQVEMAQMLTAHPSVLAARSSSKGYSPMHYAAMSGSLPVLDWLVTNGLNPDALSSPADGSSPLTPMQVAEEYKRDAAAARLRELTEGYKFLKAAPNAEDDDTRLRVACRAGNASAVKMLLRREPSLARRPAALTSSGALFAAASGGHTSCLHELIRCGGCEPVVEGPSALQAAVATQQAEAANLLHVHERACEHLQVGHWVRLPSSLIDRSPTLPLVGGLVLDAKLSRMASVVVEAYDMQLASAVGAPAMERCLVRWVENTLGLPLWVPVDLQLYLQLEEAVGIAVDALHSAKQREALLKLKTSKADALQRLSSVLPYVPFPSDVTRACRKGLGAMLGEELIDANFARLTPPMIEWVCKILFLLPETPWGARGAGMSALKKQLEAAKLEADEREKERPHRNWDDDDDGNGGAAAAGGEGETNVVRLTLCVMELLSKARLMYHLFDDDAESTMTKRLHSVLPVQAHDPSLCPFAPKADLDRTVAGSHSAVLLLLAPVNPAYMQRLYPQCLMLNDGGIGGEFREKLGHRIASRLLLSGAGAPSSVAPWVVLPAVYSDTMALAALSRLGGVPMLMLRHPHTVKFTAAGGGEISLEADDLDAVLYLLLEPEAAMKTGGGGKITKRIAELVNNARFWPEGEGPGGQGSAVLLLEELVPSQPLPQDGRKGWFDPTHRAYCLHRPQNATAIIDVTDEPQTATKADDTTGGVTVLSGCCRFPLQNLACGAQAPGGVHGQHAPQLPHTAYPLGPEMAKGAFGTRLPLAPLFATLHAVPLKDLITHCLSSPQHPLLHLVGLSILGGATAGARSLRDDVTALNFAHFEYFGRPFAVAADLHAEHQPLIDDLIEPAYAQRYGGVYGRLAQKSFLRDVVQPDLACVCCNELRAPNLWVTDRLKRLYQHSQFDDVREMANTIHSHYYSVAKSGKLNSQGEEVASKEHMKLLLDDLMHGV